MIDKLLHYQGSGMPEETNGKWEKTAFWLSLLLVPTLISALITGVYKERVDTLVPKVEETYKAASTVPVLDERIDNMDQKLNKLDKQQTIQSRRLYEILRILRNGSSVSRPPKYYAPRSDNVGTESDSE